MVDAAPHRLVYVVPAYPVLSETFVRREIDALRAAGHQVTVAALRPVKATGADEVLYSSSLLRKAATEALLHPLRSLATLGRVTRDVVLPGEPTALRTRLKLIPQAVAAFGLSRTIRHLKAQHVRAQFAHAPTGVAMYAAMQVGMPWSFTGHANDLFARRSLLRRKLERASFVACISHEHRRLYSECAGLRNERLPIVRCGVEVASSPASPASGGFHIVTVARLVPKKGIDVLIEAASRALPSVPHLTLTIAGEGPELPRLESLARSTPGLKVRFLGALAPDKVPVLMRRAHLFVLPCRTDATGDRDGIPVVLMEAMSLGVPCIAGDLPAIRELIEHDVSGLVLPEGDARTLASWIHQLSADRTRRHRLGEAGRQRVITEFSLDTNIARLNHAITLSICRTYGDPVPPLRRRQGTLPVRVPSRQLRPDLPL